jgi:hypothetical protein
VPIRPGAKCGTVAKPHAHRYVHCNPVPLPQPGTQEPCPTMILVRLFRVVCAVFALSALFGCDANDAGRAPVPMGNFNMGLNIVVPETAKTIPISRQATPDEWKTVMTQAMQDRFGSYTGDKLFDFGISIDGYMLAPPGIPVLASPRSALIVTVNVWDDAHKKLLVEGGKRITYIEGISPEAFIGSGWTQNKDKQMKKLAFNVAKLVQDYMLEHPEWLGLPPKPVKPTPPPQKDYSQKAADAAAAAALKPLALPPTSTPVNPLIVTKQSLP